MKQMKYGHQLLSRTAQTADPPALTTIEEIAKGKIELKKVPSTFFDKYIFFDNSAQSFID